MVKDCKSKTGNTTTEIAAHLFRECIKKETVKCSQKGCEGDLVQSEMVEEDGAYEIIKCTENMFHWGSRA